MMRNLKVLGLALAAIFAIGALTVAIASADTLTAEQYPVTLTGNQDEQTDAFTTTQGGVNCKKVTYHGQIVGPTKEFELAPAINECTFFGFPGTVHMNGCKYKFTMTQPGAAATTSLVDIVCPAGQEITLTVVSAGTNKCTIHIPPQNGLSHVEWVNIGAGATREITGNITISGLRYRHVKGTGLGSCTSGEAVNGAYQGKIRVTGEGTVSPFSHVGVFFS